MPLADDPRFRTVLQLIEDAEFAKALQQLDALIKQLPPQDGLIALLLKVRCVDFLGDTEQAKGLVQAALKQVDENSPLGVCLKLQRIFLSQSEMGLDKAANEMQSLLKRNAKQIKEAPDLLWVYKQAKIDLGNCLILARRYSKGIKELEEALTLDDLPWGRYYIYSWLGFAWNQVGELNKARDNFERALGQAQSAPAAGLSPYYNARLRYELALIAYKQKRLADAAHQLEFASAVGVQDTELLERITDLKALVTPA